MLHGMRHLRPRLSRQNPAILVSVYCCLGTYVTERLSAVDIDGDGDIDILVGNEWLENLDGEGDFYSGRLFTEDYLDSYNTFPVDLSGDGKVDILAVDVVSGLMTWYENQGSANFDLGKVVDARVFAYDDTVLAADLDGDGDVDILATFEDDDTVVWYENMDGVGEFSAARNITTSANGVRTVAVADLNGDGLVDIISGSSADDRIVWYRNLGDTGPAPTPQPFSPSLAPNADVPEPTTGTISPAHNGTDSTGSSQMSLGLVCLPNAGIVVFSLACAVAML